MSPVSPARNVRAIPSVVPWIAPTLMGVNGPALRPWHERGAARTMGFVATSLFLCGDVMTGRGIDQVLPHPSRPQLFEPYVRDARDYVAFAERANGRVGRSKAFDYVWGDALEELAARSVEAIAG